MTAALALAGPMIFFGFFFGIFYPLAAIAIHKLCGSKKTIRQILREI